MTTFLLIRHGETDANGKLMAGSAKGWRLNPRGTRQAQMLADRLASVEIRAIYASPLERAMETAEPIARSHGIQPIPVEGLGEIRIGAWQGIPFSELDRREDWRRFNTFRSGTCPPGGELMRETQTRMFTEIESLRARHPEDTVAVVSHSDPLRSLLAFHLGIPLDLTRRLQLNTGSLSVVRMDASSVRVLSVNQMEGNPLCVF